MKKTQCTSTNLNKALYLRNFTYQNTYGRETSRDGIFKFYFYSFLFYIFIYFKLIYNWHITCVSLR